MRPQTTWGSPGREVIPDETDMLVRNCYILLKTWSAAADTHTHMHACKWVTCRLIQPPLQLPPRPQNKPWNTASQLPAHESRRYDIAQRPRPDSQRHLSNLFIRPSTSSAPPLSSCLIKNKGPVCFTRSRQGAWRRDKTIISLAAAAAARAGARTADRILKRAAVLAQIAARPRPRFAAL